MSGGRDRLHTSASHARLAPLENSIDHALVLPVLHTGSPGLSIAVLSAILAMKTKSIVLGAAGVLVATLITVGVVLSEPTEPESPSEED